jgi:hypothetical protein
MDLSLIKERLKTTLVGLRGIGVAADLEAAMGGTVALPGAFVLPLAELGTDLGLVSSTYELTKQTFGVVHGVSNRRDPAGDAAMVDLTVLRTNLRNALVGWVPDVGNGEAVTFASGRLLRMDGDGRLWWIDEFDLKTYYWSN